MFKAKPLILMILTTKYSLTVVQQIYPNLSKQYEHLLHPNLPVVFARLQIEGQSRTIRIGEIDVPLVDTPALGNIPTTR